MSAPPGGAAPGLGMFNFGGYLGQPVSTDGLSGAPAFPPSIAINSSMGTGVGSTSMFPPAHSMSVTAAPMSTFHSSAPHQVASQPTAPTQNVSGSTPLIPPQLLLNASSAWGLPAQTAASAPNNSNMFAQQQQNAGNLLAQITSLQSQPLQNSTLAALAGSSAMQTIGPHQAHYIIMMQQLQQQQIQQQHQQLNGFAASMPPTSQFSHSAAPSASATKPVPQQHQQHQQHQHQQQQQQHQQQQKQQQQQVQSQQPKKPPQTVPTMQKDLVANVPPQPVPQNTARVGSIAIGADTPAATATEYSPIVSLAGDATSRTGSRSTVSTSPALSTATRKSRASPKPQKRGTKEPKRKAAPKKDDLAAKQKPSVGAPPAARGTQSTLAQQQQVAPGNSSAIAASAATPIFSAPLSSANTYGASATEHRAASSLVPQKPGRRASSQLPSGDPDTTTTMVPVPLPKAPSFQKPLPRWPQNDDVLGQGTERLLAFHSTLAPRSDQRGLEYWNSAISCNFSKAGNIRMDLGGQSYDMPVATAGRFYHRLFSDGSVVSIHVALSSARVHNMANASSIVSFHNILLTTTYANGRRVLEAGDLRVIFDPQFRIRVWAFTSNDATICLPRKRPNGPEDALTRTCDATIARNLDWPNESPAPKRRKSAHGKQPPDECVMPACGLQHLEVANTMSFLQELIKTQAQNPSIPTADIFALWKDTRAFEPVPEKPLKRVQTQIQGSLKSPVAERRRVRRKSVAIADGSEAMGSKDAKPVAGSTDAAIQARVSPPSAVVKKQRADPAAQQAKASARK
ncbi:hypothetical protein EV178_001773 [Coemansia sp. RSA 1646]|nr:hypothetical protein EV178_001773 [Coemansia sp. RSA 1646]KAJ2216235.1 hypothetical protein EV179_001473 [Coemansia sp. RSA 487]